MTEQRCRLIVAARSGGWCEAQAGKVCNGRATNKHHRFKPGRLWTPANVLDLCGSGTTGCHGWVEANPAAARALGLWLRSGQDPLTTAFFGAHRGVLDWWSIDDAGNIAATLSPVS